ncbi:MAG: ADP-ribosylglycohydrolase family protein [Bacilli bacterium]|nr:ADP-ribosylglycohydrolase family protein [Bacilli bacterium]
MKKYILGALIGDIAGSKYEFNNIKTKNFQPIDEECRPTDDSIMTIAIWDMFLNDELRDRERIIDRFKKWGKKYPNAGYGGRFFSWVLGDSREPYNSCGNGSAMRVSAIGWIAQSEEEVRELSYNVTEVTHNHPEGLLGAEVTAMCIYYARIGKSKEFIKQYVEQYYDLNFDYEDLRKNYVHDWEICQVTVPQAIYCFLISDSFEDCLKTTISIGGDCDTTSAISCAIAEAYYKEIPDDIVERALKIIPNDILQIVKKVYNKING